MRHAARRTPPFGHLRPAVGFALAYGAAIVVWLVAGGALPGGRWLAVHLFTLGVLSNLVVALTAHFAQTVLRAPSSGAATSRLLLLNAGTLLVLTFPASWGVATGIGAALASAAVLWLYLDLRRMRKRSLSQRFAFVVRGYERATSAFLHGALLGLLLGTGLVGGAWYGAVRLAHLHVNVLGWGGLVLLATVLFFGPTVLRARIRAGAERSAVPALRYAATALTVAVLALVVTGAGEPYEVPARLVAAAGLGVYAWAATVICVPVLRAARGAAGDVNGRLVAAACAWFPLTAWGSVATAAAGRWDLLDALGAGLLAGVLGQAILGALGYLTPMVWAAGTEPRAAARELLARFGAVRLTTHNAATAALVGGVGADRLLGADVGPLVAAGLALLAASVAGHLGLGLAAWRAAALRR